MYIRLAKIFVTSYGKTWIKLFRVENITKKPPYFLLTLFSFTNFTKFILGHFFFPCDFISVLWGVDYTLDKADKVWGMHLYEAKDFQSKNTFCPSPIPVRTTRYYQRLIFSSKAKPCIYTAVNSFIISCFVRVCPTGNQFHFLSERKHGI